MANKLPRLKPLPEYINGFRTISCFGYDKEKCRRWASVECKVCKRIYEVDPNQLKYRKHCGCMKSGRIINRYRNSHPKLHKVYKDMMNRCYNKNRLSYHNYGGRGISVCKEWKDDSNTFCEWSLINGYGDGLSIDRIDNDKGYSPENCRWATVTEQNRNRRGIRLNLDLAKEIRGSTMSYPALAKKHNISEWAVWKVKTNKIWKEDNVSGGAN